MVSPEPSAFCPGTWREFGMVSPEPVAGIGYGVPGTRNPEPEPRREFGMVSPEPGVLSRNLAEFGMVSPEPWSPGTRTSAGIRYGVPGTSGTSTPYTGSRCTLIASRFHSFAWFFFWFAIVFS